MALIFNWEARKGTLIDSVSGEQGTLTVGNGGFKQTEKGMAMEFDGITSYYRFNKIIDLNEDWSISVVGKINDFSNQNWDGYITLGNNIGSYAGGCSVSSVRMMIYDWVGSSYVGFNYTNPILDSLFHNIIITFDGTTKLCSAYLDNIDNGSNITSGTLRSPDYIFIGYQETAAGYFTGPILNAKIYDHVLTETERSILYQKFLKSSPQFKPKENIKGRIKPTDLSNEDGLVAAYNMIPSANGVLSDISGNGNNGTIVGAIGTKDGMHFDGVDDYIQKTSSVGTNFGTNPFTVMGKFKSTDITKSQGIFGSSSGNMFTFRLLNSKLYVKYGATNYQLTDILFSNIEYIYTLVRLSSTQWKFYLNSASPSVIAAPADSINISNLSIGRFDSALYFNGEIQDAKIYNRALSLSEIQAYHNSFATQTYLKENFENNAVGDTLPKGWV